MADRLEEMDVRTLSDKLAVLDANAQAGTLRGLQRWRKTHLATNFPGWRLTHWRRYCLDK